MSAARVHGALFVALAVLAVVVVRKPATPAEHVAARARAESVRLLLPRARLLATLDVVELSRTGWGRSVLEALPGLTEGSPPCVQELIAEVRGIAVALPEGPAGARDVELGIVAEGPFQAAPLVRCAAAAIRARGGDPAQSTLNGFAIVRDRKATSELAVRDGGPLVIGGGSYFRDLVERASSAQPADEGLAERLHLALRDRAGKAPLLLTWLLPPGWLEAWLTDPELAGSPYGLVRAIVLRAEPGEALGLHVQLTTDSAESAARLEPAVRRLVSDIRALSGSRGSKRAELARRGEDVEVRLTLEPAEIGALLALLRTLAEGERAGSSHAIGRAHPQEIQPEAEHVAGRGAK